MKTGLPGNPNLDAFTEIVAYGGGLFVDDTFRWHCTACGEASRRLFLRSGDALRYARMHQCVEKRRAAQGA